MGLILLLIFSISCALLANARPACACMPTPTGVTRAFAHTAATVVVTPAPRAPSLIPTTIALPTHFVAEHAPSVGTTSYESLSLDAPTISTALRPIRPRVPRICPSETVRYARSVVNGISSDDGECVYDAAQAMTRTMGIVMVAALAATSAMRIAATTTSASQDSEGSDVDGSTKHGCNFNDEIGKRSCATISLGDDQSSAAITKPTETQDAEQDDVAVRAAVTRETSALEKPQKHPSIGSMLGYCAIFAVLMTVFVAYIFAPKRIAGAIKHHLRLHGQHNVPPGAGPVALSTSAQAVPSGRSAVPSRRSTRDTVLGETAPPYDHTRPPQYEENNNAVPTTMCTALGRPPPAYICGHDRFAHVAQNIVTAMQS